MRTKNIRLLILLLAVLLSSCSSGPQRVTPSATIPATKTSTPTATPTNTATPAPTVTPSPTTDPVLLLPTYEPQEFLDHLLHDDGICKLPCWGNILSGEMTLDTAFRYLRPIIDLPEDYVYVPEIRAERRDGFWLIFNENGERADAAIHYDDDGVIQLIETFRVGYTVRDLIRTYGRPEGFYFMSDYLLDRTWETDVFFYYPDQHFMAVFEQVDQYVVKEVNFCSSKTEKDRSPDLMIWAGEEDFESLAYLYYKKSGRDDFILEVKDYATEEAIESFFAGANEEETCLVLDYPWD